MVPAQDVPRARERGAGSHDGEPRHDRELLARRDRLAERMTAMQLELGGLFYEMAIRDHVRLDVLVARATDLQQVDGELAHVDALLDSGCGRSAGTCPHCQAPHSRAAAFCWRCGGALADLAEAGP
jgi:hypothetical protein